MILNVRRLPPPPPIDLIKLHPCNEHCLSCTRTLLKSQKNDEHCGYKSTKAFILRQNVIKHGAGIYVDSHIRKGQVCRVESKKERTESLLTRQFWRLVPGAVEPVILLPLLCGRVGGPSSGQDTLDAEVADDSAPAGVGFLCGRPAVAVSRWERRLCRR